MAVILDAMAPYVTQLIVDMAREEVDMLLGVSGEIEKLKDNMESINCFLADAERRRITEQIVQRWVMKLKDAMYDATDILDLCQLEANKRKESKCRSMEAKASGCLQPLLFCLQNPLVAHKIGSRIKELNQGLEAIHKEADNFKSDIGLGSSNLEPRKLTPAEISSYKTISRVDESAIVGEQIEGDTKELVQVTGGMGKTTLAQKIFNDAIIQQHFKTKIWLSITKQFDEAELLRTAIKHAGRDHGGDQDKSALTDTLIDTLSTNGKFLLVMDDVWSQKAWNNVLSIPVRIASKKQPGSRILVTTRSEDLPQQMQAVLHQHRVRPLGNDDAWSLLKKQLQPHQVDGIDQLKTIGMKILENCGGLPIAIKVIGGLLSTKYTSEHEWNVVLNMPTWSLTGLPPEIDNRLYLSYEDLSPQLKQCFFYCSLFPKGVPIIQSRVTKMWISEGLIQPPDERSTSSHEYGLEDIATEYYRELIKRNLIEPIKGYSLTGYRCTMHDVVQSFAEYMVREESVVMVGQVQATTCAGGMLVRRLAVGQTVSVVDWAILQRHKSLRTLIIGSKVNFHPGDSLTSFSSLRVLYLWSADFDTLVPSLSKLKHLRYLHLEDSDISRLPEDIHRMKFLLYISLHGNCEKLCRLPSSIIKLEHLRFLNIDGSKVSEVPKGFGVLTNLRSLYGFPVHVEMDGSSSRCSLQELEPLSQLRDLTLYGLEKVHDSWMAEKAMISSKCHLEYLKLNYNASRHIAGLHGEAEEQQQQSVIEEVMEKLCPPTSIENLSLKGGYIGRQLPNWMRAPTSADFKSLRYLELENLPCCTELPDGLCCLPSLELLTIIDAPAIKHIDTQFQVSSTMAAGGLAASRSARFPKLKKLQLNGLREWEEWKWNDYEELSDVETTIAMPYLEKVIISNCKLSHLPQGLACSKRHTLRELYMRKLTKLTYVENFPSVVELGVFDCPKLKSISNLPMLLKIGIFRCPKLDVLQGVRALDSLVLKDTTMDTLPGYLQDVSPRYLELNCNKKLYESSSSQGSSE